MVGPSNGHLVVTNTPSGSRNCLTTYPLSVFYGVSAIPLCIVNPVTVYVCSPRRVHGRDNACVSTTIYFLSDNAGDCWYVPFERVRSCHSEMGV
jgi:hypothetical protein